MIIKGKSRSGGGELARYLSRTDTNERVQVLEMRGVAARDLNGALREIDAHGAGARSNKALYHAIINPEKNTRMTAEQWQRSVDVLEEKLGLTGQPRALVMHTKDGRDHVHVVWSRIDLEKNRAISDSHNYRKHEEASRALEHEFGQTRVQGAHVDRERDQARQARTPERADIQRAERTGIDSRAVTDEVTKLWQRTDGGRAFANALSEAGYTLAKGDKRDYVLIDRAGGVHSLSRRIAGARAADVKARMTDLDASTLSTVQEVKDAKTPSRTVQQEGPVKELKQQRQERQEIAVATPARTQPKAHDAREAQPAQKMISQTDARQDWREQQQRARTELFDRYADFRRDWLKEQSRLYRERLSEGNKNVNAESRAERAIIRQNTAPRSQARVVQTSVLAFRMLQRRDAVRERVQAQRDAARVPAYRDWVVREANAGNKAAAEQVGYWARTGGNPRYADHAPTPTERPRSDSARGMTADVEWRRRWFLGGLEYKIAGRAAVIDKGDKFKFVDGAKATDQALALGVALQVEKRQGDVRISGNRAFKNRVADVAGEYLGYVKFEDREMQERFDRIRAEKRKTASILATRDPVDRTLTRAPELTNDQRRTALHLPELPSRRLELEPQSLAAAELAAARRRYAEQLERERDQARGR